MVINAERQVIRHLTAAEGYLELGLPQSALLELQKVKEPGQYAVPHLWLTGEALRAEGRFAEAIEPLSNVIGNLPPFLCDVAKASLQECLKQTGQVVESSPATNGTASVETQGASENTDSSQVGSGAQPEVAVTQPTRSESGQLAVPVLRLEVPSVGTVSLNIEPGQALVIRIERKA
jgi:hypothetical protein